MVPITTNSDIIYNTDVLKNYSLIIYGKHPLGLIETHSMHCSKVLEVLDNAGIKYHVYTSKDSFVSYTEISFTINIFLYSTEDVNLAKLIGLSVKDV